MTQAVLEILPVPSFACAILLLGALAGDAIAQEIPTMTATVHFRVVDPFGQALPYRVAHFVSVNSKRDFASSFDLLAGQAIPYGKYSFELVRSDYASVGYFSDFIVVDESDVSLSLVYRGSFHIVKGMAVEPLRSKPRGAIIRGTVRPLPAGAKKLWVRLQSLYGKDVYEAFVNEVGEFRFEEFLRGSYVITVSAGEQLLYTGSVIFRSGSVTPQAIEIDFTKTSLSPVIVE